MAFFSRSITGFLYIVVFLSAFNAQASDDEYLKLLEQEASDLHLDQSSQRETDGTAHRTAADMVKKKWTGECDFSSDVLLADVDQAEFASYLKQCYLGTYAYFRRLDAGLQHVVYNSYRKNTPIKQSALKKEIVNYF